MFENRVTMRSQIQEMARVEKLITDEQIQDELDIYDTMIPAPGQLCASESFAPGDVRLAIDHPEYREEIDLLPGTIAELLTDPRDGDKEKR